MLGKTLAPSTHTGPHLEYSERGRGRAAPVARAKYKSIVCKPRDSDTLCICSQNVVPLSSLIDELKKFHI